MEFCEKLKQARIKANLTQQNVADLLNTSRTNISKYESGGLEPNIETLRKMIILYKTSADDILNIKSKE